jgi:tetratricopeptide (TPR) repeat protein
MPPEQAEGRLDLVDGRSDLYALGACFYEMLSGRPPFDGPTTMAVLRLILDEEPTPLRTLNPRIHRDVETICMKCLEKDPGRRYQDGRDLAADLRAFNAGEAISAAPRSWGRKLATRLKRHRELLVIFIAAVVVGLTGSGWSLYRQHVADNEIKVRERRQFSEALRDAERRRQEAEALLACPPKPTAEEEKGLGDQLDILLNQALEAYQKAILLDSASVEARDGLETTRRIGTRREVRSFLRQAREFLAKQNWPAALAFAEEVLERDPGNAEAERIQRNAIGYGRLRVDAVGPPLRVWAKPFSQAAGEGLGLNLGTTPIGGRELRLGSYILTYQTENGAKHEATATVERDQETALALYSNSQEPNMALIPAGELADFEEDGGAISVPTFHIDRFEYPNRAGFPPQSTAGLSLLEIRALCAKEGKRLCTAAQWRRACAGDGRKWPYGAIFQPEACAVGGFAEDRTNAPPSGEKTRCRTPLGVYDMSGNVAEWTDDASDRPGAAYGGDWTSPVRTPELTLSCAAREPVDLAARERLGFRCCKPLEP